MTCFVNRYVAQPGTSVTTLSAWDGRPTSALISRPEAVQPELLWLVWDLAPRYEIWLRVPVEQWQAKELSEPALLSDFVARNAAGSRAVVEVFDPAPGARPAILLTTTMDVHGAPENLAALVAGQARNAFEKTRSEPAPPALADFAEVAALLASAP